MSGKLRIFISSVQKELAAERRAVRDFIEGDALLRRFFDVFLFEDLPASGRRPDDLYLGEVERSAIYLGIFGNEYGYEDAAGISPTEREFDHAEDEERRAKKIAVTIQRLLRGDARLAEVVLTKRKPKPRLSAFTVEPQVVIDNTLSDALTVIEINGLDRPGLLYDVTREISDLNLDIASAHIATFGEKAVDVFYVTDLTGKKITSSSRESAIRDRLTKALVAKPETLTLASA